MNNEAVISLNDVEAIVDLENGWITYYLSSGNTLTLKRDYEIMAKSFKEFLND